MNSTTGSNATITTIGTTVGPSNVAQGTVNTAAQAQVQNHELLTTSFRQAYHEVGTQHVVEVDVLEQLKANMAQLEDMHHRLKFMMTELSYLLKKS